MGKPGNDENIYVIMEMFHIRYRAWQINRINRINNTNRINMDQLIYAN